MSARADFAGLLTKFFTCRLIEQRQVSSHTVASYRDTFRLLLYVQKQLGIVPQALSLDHLDVDLFVDFLYHLESTRNISARSRNTRLAAIRSFFRFVALQEPRHAALAQQVLSIPTKRYDRTQRFETQATGHVQNDTVKDADREIPARGRSSGIPEQPVDDIP